MSSSEIRTKAHCERLVVTLTAGGAEARVDVASGSPAGIAEIIATLERARDIVYNEMGTPSIRFPRRGQPRLELNLGEGVVVDDIDALIERVLQISRAAFDSDPSQSASGSASDRPATPSILPPKADSPLLACTSLPETLRAMHQELSSRSRKYPGRFGAHVFHARIGLLEDFRTLEQLGEELDPPVTRERIRQISSQIVSSMLEDEQVGDFLEQLRYRLQNEIGERAGQSPPDVVRVGPDCPIPCLRIGSRDDSPESSEIQALGRFLTSFLVDESGDPIFELTELDGGYMAIFRVVDSSEVEDLEAELVDLVVDRSRQGLARANELLPEIDEILCRTPEAVRQRTRVHFLSDLNWSDDPWANPEATLASRGSSIRSVLAAIMVRSDGPMSKKDLTTAALEAPWFLQQSPASIGNEIFRLTADPGNRDNDEIFLPIFQLVRGQFGTLRHMPVDITTMDHDAELVANIILKGRTTPDPDLHYQWHCVDLVDKLLDLGQCLWLKRVERARRWGLLDCLLRYHAPKRIVNLSKGFWVARQDGWAPEEHTKRNQSEIVERVLASGKRLSTGELRREVERFQSLGANRQLQEPVSPVVHRGGEWYLQRN